MITFTFNTIEDVKAAHRGYFFSAGATRYFKSRSLDEVYRTHDGGAYFVTSEKFLDEPRCWSVRSISQEGEIDTIGVHGGYATAAKAKAAAAHLANETYPHASLAMLEAAFAAGEAM